MSFIRTFRHIFFYALALAVLIFALKWMQWKFLIVNNSIDIYIGFIAVFFTALGIWMARQLIAPQTKTIVVEKEIILDQAAEPLLNESELKKFGLTGREYEILQLVACGYSNMEIAERIYVSISTVKTHVSNLFFKMDVKRRTQLVEKAKRLRII